MKTKLVLGFALSIFIATPLFGQTVDSFFSVKAAPGINIPVARDVHIYTFSGGMDLQADFIMPFLPILSLGADVGYNLAPLKRPPGTSFSSLSLLSGGAVVAVNFPVFFKYNAKHPIGKAMVKNWEEVPVENVKTSFFVKQYMDNPKAAKIVEWLEPGEEREIDIYGLFTNKVLDITEGTTVSALINVTYRKKGEEVTKEYIETIRLENRNTVTWDDDRKACAYVTAKDPAVLKFAKNVAGSIKGKTYRGVDKNMIMAIALHETLDLYGITYVVDPTTPYIEFSESKLAIDYLQFPMQTLEFMAGDCDDLSILYSSLLEAVGVETAFVTTSGHIFVAFTLSMTPDEARKKFLYPDDLIFREGKVWLPVEITDRNRGFIKAWETGAKEWRESAAKCGQSEP